MDPDFITDLLRYSTFQDSRPALERNKTDRKEKQ